MNVFKSTINDSAANSVYPNSLCSKQNVSELCAGFPYLFHDPYLFHEPKPKMSSNDEEDIINDGFLKPTTNANVHEPPSNSLSSNSWKTIEASQVPDKRPTIAEMLLELRSLREQARREMEKERREMNEFMEEMRQRCRQNTKCKPQEQLQTTRTPTTHQRPSSCPSLQQHVERPGGYQQGEALQQQADEDKGKLAQAGQDKHGDKDNKDLPNDVVGGSSLTTHTTWGAPNNGNDTTTEERQQQHQGQQPHDTGSTARTVSRPCTNKYNKNVDAAAGRRERGTNDRMGGLDALGRRPRKKRRRIRLIFDVH